MFTVKINFNFLLEETVDWAATSLVSVWVCCGLFSWCYWNVCVCVDSCLLSSVNCHFGMFPPVVSLTHAAESTAHVSSSERIVAESTRAFVGG